MILNPQEERRRLLEREANRKKIRRQLRHLQHVENIDEMVERMLDEMPPIYYAQEEFQAEIFYIK